MIYIQYATNSIIVNNVELHIAGLFNGWFTTIFPTISLLHLVIGIWSIVYTKLY